jgi:EAL domain-containing protein (putative c-di-GMP-specific phosphodiesterase class I)
VLLALLSQSPESSGLYHSLESKFGRASLEQELTPELLSGITTGRFTALIIDCELLLDHEPVTIQALLGISNILPTVYVNCGEDLRKTIITYRPRCSLFCDDCNAFEVAECLVELKSRFDHTSSGSSLRGIPGFDKHFATECLRTGAGLSVLAIDASSLAGIEARFGKQAYESATQFFTDLLIDIWGASGSFRAEDVLCRHQDLNQVYLVLLQANRATGGLPPPGSLEKIADRVQIQIDNKLWQALTTSSTVAGLPRGMTLIPEIRVGYSCGATGILEEDEKLAEQLVLEAVRSTSLQERRINIRRREYVQNLIATAESLLPAFQAVFLLPGLTREAVEESARVEAIGPLRNSIFGFESLIRAQKEVISEILGSSKSFALDPALLRPDVLFTLAKSVDADLELDLRAMRQALTYGQGLPGKLMINILPRNFYNLKKIRKILPHDSRIIFEVSESEAIENFDLVQEVRADLKAMNIGVATDDFGRDYGGLERIFKIKPDIIKLDRALVSNIHLDPPRLAFVTGLVQSARIINSLTLAEGVETWEEAAALQSIGVELIQGFLLHRPQSFVLVERSLQTGNPIDTVDDKETTARVIPLRVG